MTLAMATALYVRTPTFTSLFSGSLSSLTLSLLMAADVLGLHRGSLAAIMVEVVTP